MTKHEVTVIGALLILVLAVLVILFFGYAFSGEENSRSYETVDSSGHYVFMNGLFDDDIVQSSSSSVPVTACGTPKTYINYDAKPIFVSGEKALNGYYYEPLCDCYEPKTYITQIEEKPVVLEPSVDSVHYVPKCSGNVQTYITHTSSKPAQVVQSYDHFYIQKGCQ